MRQVPKLCSFGSSEKERKKEIMAQISAGPIVGMVLAECAQARLMIVSKAAMSTGMNNLVFVCDSNALAALVLLPTSLFFHRMEKIDGRSCSTLAKTLGTIVSISGALIVTLYKGPPLLMTASVDILNVNQLFSPESNWVIGGMLLGFHCVVAAIFLIIQLYSVLKKYPAELIVVFYYCFFVAIQSVVVLFFVERDLSAWVLNPKLRLFAVLYSGVFGSAFQVGVSTWCLYRTGPVFVSMFKPLGIVVAVAIGVIFLGDAFYLGSLIGAIVIVTGFYCVIWGKANEEKMDDDAGAKSLASKKQQVPLLQNIIEDI